MLAASKKCFKCGEIKTLSAFYKHPKMSDGYVNKCKECNKKDVQKNRSDNVEKYRAHDRARGNRQDYDYVKKYREENPKKYKAHTAVGNALRSGKIKKEPCEVCGTKANIVGHHDDYAKPLDVRWLCQAHHIQWHHQNGEGSNAN